MFDCVAAATILVYDLQATENAYSKCLGYQVVESSTISEKMASVWNTPGMLGRRYLAMQPASGADFTLRFVSADPVEGYAPLKTEGWNAIELLVQDTDAIAAALADSPFRMIGAPKNLSSDGNVRAAQFQGPSGEVIYLTRIAGERTRLYGSAETPVDRAFILVVGGRDFDNMTAFYGKKFGHPLQTFGKTPITVLSNALGLDSAETRYPMKLVRLGNQFNLELDGYPSSVRPRPRREGELPPGMSMVTFAVKSLEDIPLEWRSAPQSLSGSIYQAQRVAVAEGPAGEWLEFIERPNSQSSCSIKSEILK